MNVNQRCIDTVRMLAVESIEKAKSGHPGLPLGSAPMAYTLYNDFLKFNPQNPDFIDRDRFVLSAGHGSALLYSLLCVCGFDVTTDDLQNFRQFESNTPGHPELGVTKGVEISTGPLGQGIANAVGMAIAETHLSAKFNRDGYNVVDHYTYALHGDGCLMEGISYEACSLAGTLKLGKLILLYDKNNITIEGDTDLAFTEDVGARFKAMDWQVLYVDDGNDIDDIKNKIQLAKDEKDKPSIIICKTIIGYGTKLQGTSAVHGAPLGEENLNDYKQSTGWNLPPFTIPDEVKAHTEEIKQKGKDVEDKWNKLFADYEKAFPELAKEFKDYFSGNFPVKDALDKVTFDKPEATRSTGSVCLNAVASVMPNLFGGSADLAPSNKTNMKGRDYFSADNRLGTNFHYGIREHAMSAICNGISAHGGLTPYASTFFVFSDYMKNGIRLSALMNLPVTYILTHDSIGVGEDGPTHEPVEQLIGLRSIPDFYVFRPADGKETVKAYEFAFTKKKPCCIVLTRQNLPQVSDGINADKGGYVISDSEKKIPDALLIASGSEVEICLNAQKELRAKGVDARVVSMPCMELYESQSEEYKESVIPSSVRARVCVEAGSAYSWYKYAGLDGRTICIDEFGKSAPYKKLFEHYGFTVENVVNKTLEIVNK